MKSRARSVASTPDGVSPGAAQLKTKHEALQLSGLNMWTWCGHDSVASLSEQTLLIFGSTSHNLDSYSVIPEHATLLSWTRSFTQASLARCVLKQTPI